MLVGQGLRAREQQVDILHSSSERIWVQGLEVGDRVIVSNNMSMVAGMQVSVNDIDQLAGDIN